MKLSFTLTLLAATVSLLTACGGGNDAAPTTDALKSPLAARI